MKLIHIITKFLCRSALSRVDFFIDAGNQLVGRIAALV